MIRKLAGLEIITGLSACSARAALDDTKLAPLELYSEQFFDGRVLAQGQFQDRLGSVRRRFDVKISGTWDGKTLTLVEDFVYADKTEERRTRALKKTGEETWRGTAPGVIGDAMGLNRE